MDRSVRRVLLALMSLLVLGGLDPFCAAAQQAPEETTAAPKKTTKNKKTKEPAAPAKHAKEDAPYHEDFTVMPVAKNSLHLEMAILGEVDDLPAENFIRERWHLSWRPGDPIDVYVIKPRGVEKPPVVLYLYGVPADTDRFKLNPWCRLVTDGGYAAVGFVSAVSGQRLEYRRPTDDFIDQMQEGLGATVHDVQMILNYLSTRKDLDTSRVGMFGQGSGGAVAILASAVDPRIKALDLLTPWGDWPLFLEKSSFISRDQRTDVNKPEFLKTIASLEPLDWFPEVKAKSVRIQNLRKTGHMPDEGQEKMEEAAPSFAEIDQFGDAAALQPVAMGGRLLGWMKDQLKPDAKPQIAMERSQRTHFYPPKAPEPIMAPH